MKQINPSFELMRMNNKMLILLIVVVTISLKATGQEPGFYPVSPVPFTKVNITDEFWSGRIKTNREVTIPFAFEKCEETGRIDNFRIAGGIKAGDTFPRRGFDDSDVYKIMEGAAYSLASYPDKELDNYLDTLIYYIGKAQEEDGYLYTVRTILKNSIHRDLLAPRWINEPTGSHELYNAGHMYEAAVAHYMATGKRSFLDIAVKNAKLVERDLGWDKLVIVPGHQETELALVKLYTATGDTAHLKQAKFFLDARGTGMIMNQYFQLHKKVTEETEAVGHAVRAMYMYSAMADISALTGDHSYKESLNKLWNDVAGRKLYITGGVGPGSGNSEGFGPPYLLPNLGAYCETCAAIGNVFWNYRMFLATGKSFYIDILERSLYNNVLSGISLEGNRFFYPNKLESNGEQERRDWFNVPCCPANLCRFIPSVPGYIYASKENELFINLFISSETEVNINNNRIRLVQDSEVPWRGKVDLTFEPARSERFTVKIRIPGWASETFFPTDLYRTMKPLASQPTIRVNGKKITFKVSDGYAIIDRTWTKMDKISIDFPFVVHEITAHPLVEANKDRVALQRGPLVYCLEHPDNPEGKVVNLLYDTASDIKTKFMPDMLGGIMTLSGKAFKQKSDQTDSGSERITFTAIPYYAWAHRGQGEMVVWIPIKKTPEK